MAWGRGPLGGIYQHFANRKSGAASIRQWIMCRSEKQCGVVLHDVFRWSIYERLIFLFFSFSFVILFARLEDAADHVNGKGS